MQESYVIIWVAKAKDRSGVGKKYFTKEGAEALAAELNGTHPDFHHQAIDAANEDPVNALVGLRESLAKISGSAVPLPEFVSQQARDAELSTADPKVRLPGSSGTEASVNLVWAA